MTLRSLLLCLLVVAVPISLTGCGIVRGDKDIDTDKDVGDGSMGEGPGLITGKRGGIIIYQR